MSTSEFESLVTAFLDGGASEVELARLRAILGQSAEFRARFQSRVRLHKAQLGFLGRYEVRSLPSAMAWLSAYGQRLGRNCAHLCMLALVLVQLQITIPTEYSGLLSYIDAPAVESAGMGGADMPIRLLTDSDQGFEPSPSSEMPELTMPHIVTPDMAMPTEEPTAVEV